MKSYSPDKRSMTVLRIASVLTALVLIAAAKMFVKKYVIMLALSIVFAIAALIVVFIYLPLYFSNLCYHATDSEIKKRSGVFFRKNQSIKYSSIQYSTVVRTPFSEYTGLNFIVFYVYGGRFLMLFIKSDDAQEILKKSGSMYC